jgi:hypothetical protein
MRRLAKAAGGAFLFALLLPTSAGAQLATPTLSFVAPDELAVSGSDKVSDEFSVWLSNDSAQPVLPRFTASLEDSDGNPVLARDVSVAPAGETRRPVVLPVPADGVARYRIELVGAAADENVSGQLVATAAGVGPASVPITVGPEPAAGNSAYEVLLISLIAAAALMLIVYAYSVLPKSPLDPLGELDFDFTSSFASTLTAVGALLGTIIGAGVLPDQTVNLSKEAFTALYFLFGVAIVVAPVVYLAGQRSAWIPKEGDTKKEVRKSQGFVGLFILSCFITVWAVFGELYTTWLLAGELGQAGKGFSTFAVDIFRVLLVAGALSLIAYTFWRVGAIVWPEREKKTRPRRRRVRRAVTPAAEREPKPASAVPKSLPKVSLL